MLQISKMPLFRAELLHKYLILGFYNSLNSELLTMNEDDVNTRDTHYLCPSKNVDLLTFVPSLMRSSILNN